jgi:four helix bundle protein
VVRGLGMQDFRNLKVWEKAHRLTLDVYKISADFPSEEKYGLTSQLRRASSSIATNIAEGCGRDSKSQMKNFAQIAMGSASEVEYLLLLCRDLGFLRLETYVLLDKSVVEVKRMLSSYIISIREQ